VLHAQYLPGGQSALPGSESSQQQSRCWSSTGHARQWHCRHENTQHPAHVHAVLLFRVVLQGKRTGCAVSCFVTGLLIVQCCVLAPLACHAAAGDRPSCTNKLSMKPMQPNGLLGC
jgi:hypothetical protein